MSYKKLFFQTFLRSFFIQSTWNFERMQNIGFAYVLMPFFREVYPDREQRKAVLLRHLEFFNTHPYMVSVILGIVASMENEMMEKKTNSAEEITLLKTHMAGPLAAIGDTFFWATWRPFSAILAVSLVLFYYSASTFRGTWLAPLFFLAVFNLFHVPFRYWSLRLSYQLRTRTIRIIAGLEFQRASDIIRFIGFIALLLVAVYYLFAFAGTVSDKIIYFLVFILTVTLGCLRLPPSMTFYSITVFSLALVWLKW